MSYAIHHPRENLASFVWFVGLLGLARTIGNVEGSSCTMHMAVVTNSIMRH